MSVPVGERCETKLSVVENAEELAVYTIQIVSNEKHFPKRYRWCLSNSIVKDAIAVNELVHEANSIYPIDKLKMNMRLQLELDAFNNINGLLSLVTLSKKLYNTSLDNIDYWLNKITYERTLLMKWRESDEERLLKLSE